MSETVSEDQLRAAVAAVKHPMIDKTLAELGIVKLVNVAGSAVKCVVAFPFPGIPIAQQLLDSIERSLAALGATVEFEQSIMAPDELQRFLALETEGWRGSR